MSKYDAIVIGAGIGGLSVGAMLAKAGQKVLVLEKSNHLGGRAFSTTHKGHVVDHGIHAFIQFGHLAKVFSRAGKPFPADFITAWDTMEAMSDGKWRKLGDLIPHKEFRKLFNEHILPLSLEDCEKVDHVSLKDWVARWTDNPDIHRWFYCMGWAMCVAGSKYEAVSAGETLYYLRELLNERGGFTNISGYCRGGLSSLAKPLAEGIRENGGEVRLNSNVSSIVVEKGKVKGVRVEKGERVFPIQVLDTGFIDASVVVNTLPIWDLFGVISPDEFPGWYVDSVTEMSRKVDYIWGIRYSLDKPLQEDESIMRWWEISPTAGKILLGAVCAYPEYGKAAGEYVADFWQQGIWDDVPANFRSGNRIVSHEAKKILDVFDKDVNSLFPDVQAHCRDKIYYAGFYSLAEAPANVGKYRLGMRPPLIKNLYLTSDTLCYGRVGGIGTVARGALKCVDMIMDKS